MPRSVAPVNDEDLCFRSASDAAELIRTKVVSPAEVLDAVAKRIEAWNPAVNAYCTLDLDRARKDAHLAGEVVAHGGDLGPLHGVPVAIKDDLAVKGMRYTAGSRLWADHIADYDDAAVARLRRAGAIIVGKTNLPEFGHKGTTDNVLFGTTANPWDRGRSAGGSSGGSGAAVAAGLAYLALGTDIAGSIRIPASLCGVVGHKPSLGRVPRVPAGNVFDTAWAIGPLTRTVRDAALALRVLGGVDDRDPFSLPAPPASDWDLTGELKGLRVAWCPSPAGDPVEPAPELAARGTADRLAGLGIKVEAVDAPLRNCPYDALVTVFRVDTLLMAGIADAAGFAAAHARLSPTLAAVVAPGLDLSRKDYMAALAAITRHLETEAAPALRGFDALLTPTTAVPAFAKDLPLGPDRVAGQVIDPQVRWAFTWPFNITGQPAVSVPCGRDPNGLPLGLQVVGRRGADALVLRIAAAVERERPGADRRPQL
jgi:Asp-tRNA(Asn)/Glu-tRNA(Gln) amidotransferase A subunit family amidase